MLQEVHKARIYRWPFTIQYLKNSLICIGYSLICILKLVLYVLVEEIRKILRNYFFRTFASSAWAGLFKKSYDWAGGGEGGLVLVGTSWYKLLYLKKYFEKWFGFCTVTDRTRSNIKNAQIIWQTMPLFLNGVIISVLYIIFTACMPYI